MADKENYRQARTPTAMKSGVGLVARPTEQAARTSERNRCIPYGHRGRGSLGAIAVGLIMGLAVLVCGVSGWPPAARADDPAVISGVRVGVHEGVTRFVMTLNRGIRYRTFTLANPYRVVIDMPMVDWQLAEQAELDRQSTIEAFRFGAFTPTTTRVVLDVNRPVQIHRVFVLRPQDGSRNWRLVVDIKEISEDEFHRLARLRRQRAQREGGADEQSGGPPVRRRERDSAARSNGRPLIVIDPGHGGVDPGALSPNGTREKDVVLQVSRTIAEVLRETGQYRALLTRDRDFYIPLRERYRLARERDAQLFISVHADSNPQRSTRGLSVYTLSERASDAEAEALARRENRSDAVAGVDLTERSDQVAGILIDLAQRETMNQSARFAEMLIGEMRETTHVLRRTHRFAGFAVLKAPDVPSVLVELGYLTNPRDERRLRDEEHHRQLARAIARAISEYFAYRTRVEGRTRAQSR